MGFLDRIKQIRKEETTPRDSSHGADAWLVSPEEVIGAAKETFPEGRIRDLCVAALTLSMNVDAEDDKKTWDCITGVRDALFECGARKDSEMFEVVQFLNEMLPLERRTQYYRVLGDSVIEP